MPNRFIDAAIVYRILKMLVTPFDKTDAFHLGIIDAKGKILKKAVQLKTTEERNAYTLLHRLVFRLKRIIEKVPIENKKFLSYAAAFALIREQYEKGVEPINLERMFLESLKQEHDTTLVENFFNNKYSMTFKQYLDEEDGGAPANNAAVSGGIAGLPPDEPPVPKMNKLNMFRRKRKNEFMGKI